MKLDHLDRVNLGRVIRKKRKNELGWSMETLAQISRKKLSVATISNIERGYPGVSEVKIELLCQLIGLDLKEMPALVQKESEWHKKWIQELKRIEQIIDLVSPEEAHRRLRKISFDSGEALEVVYQYLLGRCYFHKRNYAKASEKLNLAIQLLDKYPEMEYTNIRATSFKELGRIAFHYYNDLEQALNFTEEGIKVFRENGERISTKFALLSAKASYLEKLGHNDDALKVIELLWNEKENWYQNLEVVLNIYEIRANISSKAGLFEEALKLAEEGLELARANRKHERAFELMTLFGNIHTAKQQYDEAEAWYQQALLLKEKIKRQYLFITTYTQLGILYMTLKKWNQAKNVLHEAVELGKKSEDPVRYHHALIALGDYYLKTNDEKTALMYYEQSLEQAEKGRFHTINPDLYAKLSRCWQELDIKKSKEYMDKYLQLVIK